MQHGHVTMSRDKSADINKYHVVMPFLDDALNPVGAHFNDPEYLMQNRPFPLTVNASHHGNKTMEHSSDTIMGWAGHRANMGHVCATNSPAPYTPPPELRHEHRVRCHLEGYTAHAW